MPDPLLDNLNPPQRQAVETVDGPLLILAGAGSGKTRVITHRIAYLIDRMGVPPWQVLAVTFTNKAAQEMRERVERLLESDAAAVRLGTFHSICARVLRRYIDRLGFETSFSIYDADDQLALVRRVMKDLDISNERFQPNAVLSAIGRFKQDMQEPGDIGNAGHNLFLEVAARVYEIYQQRLKEANSLDFDDLLNLTVKLLRDHDDVRLELSNQWRYVLVDEYQDTNRAQYLFLLLLTREHTNICVVGDDDQSIYRWRGADINNILSFEKDFPDAKVVKLEQNYRSTGIVLDIAHNVIAKNVGRKPKKLWTDLGEGEKAVVYAAETEGREAQYIAETIRNHMAGGAYSYRDFAVFYRTNAQSRAIEQQFVMSQVPYTIIGGLRFYERKEIKDALAYLRVLANPADEINLLRIVNVPARGIGAVTVGRLRDVAHERGTTLFVAMQSAVREKTLSTGPGRKLAAFVKLMDQLIESAKTTPVNEILPEVLEMSGYWAMLNRENSDEAKDRIANLNELINEASEFVAIAGEEASLQSFLERTALISDIDSFEGEKDTVSMMTVHSAKGLEFPVVFISGMEEQLFPHSRSMDSEEELEEERRLAYVGITRARKKLYFSLARTRMVFGQTRTTLPSRFLADISAQYLIDRSGVTRPAPSRANWSFGGGQPVAPRYEDQSQEPENNQDFADTEYEPTFDADTGEPLSAIQPGVKVYHPSWGVGKVAAVVGSGPEAKVTVMFPSVPLKRVIAKYLQPVG